MAIINDESKTQFNLIMKTSFKDIRGNKKSKRLKEKGVQCLDGIALPNIIGS